TGGCGQRRARAGAGADRVTYVTGLGSYGREGFVWVAAAKGFFREVNLDLTAVPGAAGDSNGGPTSVADRGCRASARSHPVREPGRACRGTHSPWAPGGKGGPPHGSRRPPPADRKAGPRKRESRKAATRNATAMSDPPAVRVSDEKEYRCGTGPLRRRAVRVGRRNPL